jgi:cysteinyl-tRNA synthetase
VLHDFEKTVGRIRKKAGNFYPDNAMAVQIEEVFTEHMNNDLDVRGAVNALRNLLSDMDINRINPEEASGLIRGLKKLDSVLRVIF